MSFVNSVKSSKQAKRHKSWKKLALLITYISWEVLSSATELWEAEKKEEAAWSLNPEMDSLKGVLYVPPGAESAHGLSPAAPVRWDEQGKRQRAREQDWDVPPWATGGAGHTSPLNRGAQEGAARWGRVSPGKFYRLMSKSSRGFPSAFLLCITLFLLQIHGLCKCITSSLLSPQWYHYFIILFFHQIYTSGEWICVRNLASYEPWISKSAQDNSDHRWVTDQLPILETSFWQAEKLVKSVRLGDLQGNPTHMLTSWC